jgi:acetyl esterase/lipase
MTFHHILEASYSMKRKLFLLLFLSFLIGCGPGGKTHKQSQTGSLVSARQGLQTKLLRQEKTQEKVAEPPGELFRIVQYDSSAGKLAAYLSPNPKDGRKHPAIVWITGGDCNSIGEVWGPAPPSNDQTARAFREAGILMMFPSLRGGNENPGVKEGFFHEVDDVLAAADYLAKQDFIDPTRIYLGGHSTGGTLVLLTSEISPRFRAVFSFGPVSDIRSYPSEFVPFDATIRREWVVRSPGLWLHCIESQVFVFEGTKAGNLDSLQTMASRATNTKVQFFPVEGASHFSILAPVTRLIADKVFRDNGKASNITFTKEELDNVMAK